MQKAEVDWLSASSLTETASSRRRPLHDSICFHCQQTAEKYLKALLQELGQFVPRTHDLEDLLDSLIMAGSSAIHALARWLAGLCN